VEARVASSDDLAAVEYIGRLRRLAQLRRAAAEEAGEIDVVATPTVPITPPAVAELAEPKVYARKNLLALRNTALFSYMGWCAVSVPVGLDRQGMPVGLQLARPSGEDLPLLELAVAVERVIGDPAARLGSPPGLGAAGAASP
jgi:aspartyl-tRNA(Asn)/glutamyl-tRNA(Gln) amidotransferase subunit A